MSNVRTTALLAICAVLLIGCGGAGKSAPNKPKAQANVSLPAPTFAEGSSMDRIQKAGTLKVGVSYAQPGFGYKPSAGGAPEGFDIEIAERLAQGIFGGTAAEAGKKIAYTEAVSTNRETFLQNDSVDMVVSAYPITDARKRVVDFAGPYFMSHGDVMVKSSDNNAQRLSDLNGRSICIKSGSSYPDTIRSQAPQISLVTRDTYAQCQQDLTSGTVSGIVSDTVVLAGLVQASAGTLKAIGSDFSNDPYGIGLKKGDDVFRTFLNARLLTMMNDGDWTAAYVDTIGKLDLPVPQPPAIDPIPQPPTPPAAD